MQLLSNSSSKSQVLASDIGSDVPSVRAPDKMNVTQSFVARVKIQLVEGNVTHEYLQHVSLKQSSLASYLVIRRAPQSRQSVDIKKSNSRVYEFPVERCVKITPWQQVERVGSVAIHFEKNMEVRGSQQKLKAKKTGRTKNEVVTIGQWSSEGEDTVKEIWMLLNHHAQENKQNKPQLPNGLKSGLSNSLVDARTRMRERLRGTEPAVMKRVSAKSLSRLSQGQRAMQALSGGLSQKPGRYSALGRGAVGEKILSASLVGPPNLNGLRQQSKKSVLQPPLVTSSVPEWELRKPDRAASRQKRSITEMVPEGGSTSKQNRGRNESTSSMSPQQSNSIPATARNPNSGKRLREHQGSPESLERRKRYLENNLRAHRERTQTMKTRRPQVQPNPPSKLHAASPVVPTTAIGSTSGILNEGNTCYLSSVLQALMSDEDFMTRIRARVFPKSTTMPFSNALIGMVKNRESSLALNAGEAREAISKHFPQFSSSDQQDAHEFFIRCLDVVANECSLKYLQDSPTHTHYSLVQERKLKCTTCGHRPDARLEILRGLSLDIPVKEEGVSSENSLQNLVQSYFQPQELELDCERCKGKRARSESRVVLAPRTLVLHVKRFGVTFDSKSKSVSLKKISESVRVPESVSLTSVLAEDAASPITLDQCVVHEQVRKVTPTRIDEELDMFSGDAGPADGGVDKIKKQGLSQSAHLLLPSESVESPFKRPRFSGRSHDFARRIRIHAEPGEYKQGSYGGEQRKEGKVKPVCRTLDFSEDEIEDDYAATQGGALYTRNDEKDIEDIMCGGLPRCEAEAIWKECNHDKTRAMGVASDRLKELRRTRPDLDGVLLSRLRQREGRVKGGWNRATKAEYKLVAVIRHDSDSVERGHYVADVLQSDGSWYCYNDSIVSKLDSRNAQDAEGYLCWYVRQEVEGGM